jgi:hypothetical protein
MNKLIAIGYLGCRKCYLNIERDLAIEMYCKSENLTREEFDEDLGLNLQEFTFDNIFEAYDVWK